MPTYNHHHRRRHLYLSIHGFRTGALSGTLHISNQSAQINFDMIKWQNPLRPLLCRAELLDLNWNKYYDNLEVLIGINPGLVLTLLQTTQPRLSKGQLN